MVNIDYGIQKKISEFFNKQNTPSSSPTEPKQCPISGPSKT